MAPTGAEPPGAKRARRSPAKATPRHLQNVALHYLQRYSSSVANLRRVLMRRVIRSAEVHGSDVEEGRAAIEALLERMQSAGLLDDTRYAEGSVRALARRGRSVAGIRATLARKGVPNDVAEAALDDLRADQPDLNFAAAVAYARRRRLGPFRAVGDRRERRTRDLASMARAGYPLAIARRVVDAADVEALLEESAGLF